MNTLHIELAEKQKHLEVLQGQLVELQDKLSDIEVNPGQYYNLESLYDEELDEIYSEVCEALPVNISGSQLIAEHDPVAYRCGFSDFCFNYNYASLDVYRETESEIEDIEHDIEVTESEIEDIESELEESEQE